MRALAALAQASPTRKPGCDEGAQSVGRGGEGPCSAGTGIAYQPGVQLVVSSLSLPFCLQMMPCMLAGCL